MNYLGLFLQHLHDDLDLRQKRLAYFGQDKKPRISLKKKLKYIKYILIMSARH